MKSRLSIFFFMVSVFLPPVYQPDDVLSKNDIGKRVEKVLREASYCEMTTTVTQVPQGEGGKIKGGTEPVVIKSVMTQNAFKSLVYDKSEKLIMAFALSDGRLWEYRPRAPHRPLLQYDAPFLHGTDDTVFHEEEDCLVGTLTFSWVGVPHENEVKTLTDIAGSFQRKIEEGELEADARESNRDCYVFRQIIPVANGKIEHILYVDKNSFLVVRWDTVQPGVQRIRQYDIRVCDFPPENVDWLIDINVNISKKQ